MKKILLLLVVLLANTIHAVSSQTIDRSVKNAQLSHYQTAYSNRKAYYKAEYGIIKTLKFDSCQFSNDSIFYPAHSIEPSDFSCFNPLGYDLSGSKVIISSDWNYILNNQKDTIKFKTNAVLNQKWTLYQSPNLTIEATVIKWDTATVMGVIDSVKTIQLRVYDASMRAFPHPFDNFLLKISKHYGLTQTMTFGQFPSNIDTKPYYLIGITQPELGEIPQKWFDINDFEVGDEFHYLYNGNYLPQGGKAYETKSIVTILKREQFKDSILYTKKIQELRNEISAPGAPTQSFYEERISTETIRKNTKFEQDPGLPAFNTDSTGVYVCNLFMGKNEDYYIKSDKCWTKVIDDACNFTDYSKGRGLIYRESGCWILNVDILEQVYYKKGNVSWGKALLLSNITPNAQTEISIWPNPTEGEIYIRTGNVSNCTIEITNLQGQLQARTCINSVAATLNISGLARGMYIYKILNKGKLLQSGKLHKIN